MNASNPTTPQAPAAEIGANLTLAGGSPSRLEDWRVARGRRNAIRHLRCAGRTGWKIADTLSGPVVLETP
jgi:hypothetical protein